MATRKGVDYIAALATERPVSHHFYLRERRRSGNWIAELWRQESGGREEVSYFNVKTGALVNVQRDEIGQIVGVTITQRADYKDDRREPTGEHKIHLGERCEVWRSPRSGPGIYMLRESCVTNDGVELWSRAFSSNKQEIGSPVKVSSLSRKRVDPNTTRPPRELFDWAYWQARASSTAAVRSANAAPDHSVWFEESRTAERGFVIAARYKNNWRSELSRRWFDGNSSHECRLQTPSLHLHALVGTGQSAPRELSISIVRWAPAWRPDATTIERDINPQTILGRQCYWLRPRNPPSDVDWQDCWTDDNLVLARQHSTRGGAYSVTAVRLDETKPRAPLAPPPEIFAWAREVTN
jgi:hypothetical protein